MKESNYQRKRLYYVNVLPAIEMRIDTCFLEVSSVSKDIGVAVRYWPSPGEEHLRPRGLSNHWSARFSRNICNIRGNGGFVLVKAL